jgi:hypothetical protein
LGRPVKALVALEYQQNGWPHFHPLIGVDGGLLPGEQARLGDLWFVRNGAYRLEPPRSVGGAAAYLAKYLFYTPEQGDLIIWPETGPLQWRSPVRPK